MNVLALSLSLMLAPPAPPVGPELLSAPDEDVFALRASGTRVAALYDAHSADGRVLRQVSLKKKASLPAPAGEVAQREPFFVGAKRTGSVQLGADGVWSVRLDGKPACAASSAADLQAAASPDGRWVVFVSGRSGQGDLYRVAADGKVGQAPERLSSGVLAELLPVWSPDSASVLALRLTDRGRELVLFSGFGATAREAVIVDDRLAPINAVFRPDGQTVAFVSRTWSTETTLYTVPATGGPASSVLKGVSETAPVWVPGKDNRWLLLAVTQRDAVVALDPLGGLALVATQAFGHGELAVAQLGGERVLLFTALGLTTETAPRPLGRAGLYRMSLPATVE